MGCCSSSSSAKTSISASSLPVVVAKKKKRRIVDFHCAVCGLHKPEYPNYQHQCPGPKMVAYEVDRLSTCSRCEFNREGVCIIQKTLTPDKEALIEVGVAIPDVRCPRGKWNRVRFQCDACGSVVVREKGVALCPVCHPQTKPQTVDVPRFYDEPLTPSNRYCVVTVAVGQHAYEIGEYTIPRMQEYAKHVGADFHVIRDDQFPQFPVGNKFRVGRLTCEYDRVLYLDIDTWLMPDMDDVFQRFEPGHVWMHPDTRAIQSGKWLTDRLDAAKKLQRIQLKESRSYNTGVVLWDQKDWTIWMPPRRQIGTNPIDEQVWVEQQALWTSSVRDLPSEYNTQWYWSRFRELHMRAKVVHLANCPHTERLTRLKTLQLKSSEGFGRTHNAPHLFSPTVIVANAPSDLVDRLAIITPHWNPARFSRNAEVYRQWRPSLGNWPVTCVELVIGDQEPEIDGSMVIRGTEDHVLWQKERMINLAIERLPPEIQYVAWIDHDILIDDPDWLVKSISLIDRGVAAVQPWGELRYLDREGRVVEIGQSAGVRVQAGSPPVSGPGGAWVASRSAMDQSGGLYELNPVGGGDTTWFSAVSDKHSDFLDRQPPASRVHAEQWVSRNRAHLTFDCIPCPARHLWHGDRRHRQYTSRDGILRKYAYDPERHVEIDQDNGLLRWSRAAPSGLRSEVRAYFASRREDG